MLLNVEGVDDAFELYYGVSKAADWSSDAFCLMDPRWPKDIVLSDSPAGASVLIVSAGLRQQLLELGVNNCEFLPLTIFNHKQRVASRDYFVINPLDFCDCINMQASGVEWNDIGKDSLCACTCLVLRWDVVPTEYKIFRLHHWPNVVVVRTEVAQALLSSGWSGLHFIEPMKYTGLR